MRRSPGSGHIHIKSGAYYVRWRSPDGRNNNRRVGKVRTPGKSDGLTRAQAERAARALAEKEGAKPPRPVEYVTRTVDDVADAFRDRLLIEGARLSYRQNCESMQRVHISRAIGKRRVEIVTSDDIEGLVRVMLQRGSSRKTVRNTMTFLHSVFALAVSKGWAPTNPVLGAAGPKRRRDTDADRQTQRPSVLPADARRRASSP